MSEQAQATLTRYGVRLGRHTIFMPKLVRPRAAQTLAVLWHCAHPGKLHSVLLARPGALSLSLDRARVWGEIAAAGYRACGRFAVRLDLVERLAEAIDADPPLKDAALARLIGRSPRDLPNILSALGYQRTPETEGAPARWRRLRRRRKRETPAETNAFAELANLLPQDTRPPPRRRRSTA
jgi:ATP-dependent RNA helicase SUPV3L1/SUV3